MDNIHDINDRLSELHSKISSGSQEYFELKEKGRLFDALLCVAEVSECEQEVLNMYEDIIIRFADILPDQIPQIKYCINNVAKGLEESRTEMKRLSLVLEGKVFKDKNYKLYRGLTKLFNILIVSPLKFLRIIR